MPVLFVQDSGKDPWGQEEGGVNLSHREAVSPVQLSQAARSLFKSLVIICGA